ncbi:HAMP domain-containing histidine kinase [Alphaproteobacteria bacterium]|nr:HAMP domain-containing histidine kinase [Alphaproteobacteria bacterium]
MDQVTHGVNNRFNFFSLSNYSLTKQIVLINLLITLVVFIVIVIFNIFSLSNNKNIDNHTKIINSKLYETTKYLSNNAVKRILTFDDSCNSISERQESEEIKIENREESRINCKEAGLVSKNFNDQPPQLDRTYTQQYIYSNFLESELIVKVYDDNWTVFADTSAFYVVEEEVIIMDIDSNDKNNNQKNDNFYLTYQKIYFDFYNSLLNYFARQKLKKLKNNNITVMETIKSKETTSYMFEDQNGIFSSIFASPIIKDNKVYGVVLIIAPFAYNPASANQSITITNFFIFFASILFLFSTLFSKSIVGPIKTLSKITQLERDKSYNKKDKIVYPKRRDEIGILSNDIKSMSEDLKKRVQEIEQFAADVSHELKNPLSGLKSSSDLLKIKKLNEKKTDLLVKNMGEDIDRMNILISDISNYTLTQVEISESTLEKVEVINFLYKFTNSLANKKFDLTIESKQEEIYIEINKNKFLQVINNLIDNSLSYVKINPKLLINLNVEGQYCVLNYVDQGPGISLDYKDKIFERFYTDRKDDRKSHSGLGLSISKSIIESFGGKISLKKNTHKDFEGACFEIKLPLKES